MHLCIPTHVVTGNEVHCAVNEDCSGSVIDLKVNTWPVMVTANRRSANAETIPAAQHVAISVPFLLAFELHLPAFHHSVPTVLASTNFSDTHICTWEH